MIKMKKTAALLTALFMMFLCGWTQGENLQDRSVPATEEYVKLTGRTVSENGICWMIHSGSTLGFRFTGTKASVEIIGDSSVSGQKDSQARFAVYVNGERISYKVLHSGDVVTISKGHVLEWEKLMPAAAAG